MLSAYRLLPTAFRLPSHGTLQDTWGMRADNHRLRDFTYRSRVVHYRGPSH